VGWGRDARDRLALGGLDVRYHEDPVDHTIAPGAVTQAKKLLRDALDV